MILATHAVVGAAVARLFPSHPFVGFIAAFASHFIADAIPHWHYNIRSFKRGDKNHLEHDDLIITKKSGDDLLKIGADFLLGIFLAGFFFSGSDSIYIWLTGALIGILPDPLQFAYWKLRREPLKVLQKFHLWIHAEKRLDDSPRKGIAYQVIIVIAAVYISKYFA